MKNIPCALTIAGTDPSGGAGIQADLKTFQELKSYGMSVITSVVAQNTTGVQAIHHLPLDIIEAQLQSIISDMPVHAFKTGMIANIDMMKIIVRAIGDLQAPFIMDPVMVTTSGDNLIAEDAQQFLCDHLLPLTTLVTPNIPETEIITGDTITSEADMRKAAQKIVEQNGAQAVLVTGGHLIQEQSVDILYDGQHFNAFPALRIDTENSHGTGCTLSAAITAYLSQGQDLPTAVSNAKAYITAAINHSFDLGQGSGPTNHWALRIKEAEK